MSATQGDVQCSPKCSDEQISLSDKCLFLKKLLMSLFYLFIYFNLGPVRSVFTTICTLTYEIWFIDAVLGVTNYLLTVIELLFP